MNKLNKNQIHLLYSLVQSQHNQTLKPTLCITKPTSFLTHNPTPAPTFLFWEEIDYDLSFTVVVLNECYSNGNEFKVITSLDSDVVENINVHNEEYARLEIIQSCEVLSQISELTCHKD